MVGNPDLGPGPLRVCVAGSYTPGPRVCAHEAAKDPGSKEKAVASVGVREVLLVRTRTSRKRTTNLVAFTHRYAVKSIFL